MSRLKPPVERQKINCKRQVNYLKLKAKDIKMKCLIFKEPPADFHPRVEAAGCFCEWQDQILMLKRAPHSPQGRAWCSPGGKIEKGETPRDAVIREIREEVGLDIDNKKLQELGKLFARLPHLDYVFHVFRIPFSIQPRVQIAADEHVEYKWVTFADALKLPLVAGGDEILKYFLEKTLS